MIHYYSLENKKIVEKQDSLTWIHLENPSEAEMKHIQDIVECPLDYFLSTLDPDEVSRSEQLDQEKIVNPALISLLYPIENKQFKTYGSYKNRTLSIILVDQIVVTCCKSNPQFLDNVIHNQFGLVTEIEDLTSIIIEILWQVTRAYIFACRDVENQMNQLYDDSKSSTKSELLYQLADLDRSTIYMATAIEENDPILKQLEQASYLTITQQNKDWLHDILVESHQASRMINQTHKILAQLDTTFSSLISHNLNEIMKILTSVTIIITIPTIIGGLWGMNVNLPFMSHPFAFIILIIITILLMIITMLWLKKKDLL